MPDEPRELHPLGASAAASEELDLAQWARALRSSVVLGTDEPANMMALASQALGGARRPNAATLDRDLETLWLALVQFEKEQPSPDIRLAAGLITAARLLLSGAGEKIDKSTARKRDLLASGAKSFVLARGGAWLATRRNASSDAIKIALADIARILGAAERKCRASPPEEDADPITTWGILAAAAICGAWESEKWPGFRELLERKGLPVDPPPTPAFARKVASLLQRLLPTSTAPWGELAGNILTAGLRLAGVASDVADALVLRPLREESENIDIPRKGPGECR